MPLILRSTKGSPLTFNELDGNFTYLSESISEGGGTPPTASYALTASYVQNALTASYFSGSVSLIGALTATPTGVIITHTFLFFSYMHQHGADCRNRLIACACISMPATSFVTSTIIRSRSRIASADPGTTVSALYSFIHSSYSARLRFVFASSIRLCIVGFTPSLCALCSSSSCACILDKNTPIVAISVPILYQN